MRRILISLIFVLTIFFITRKNIDEYEITGKTMGSIQYNIKYISNEKKISKLEIDSILIEFNKIFSTYIPDSEISVVNRSIGKVRVSDEFGKLISESKSIYELSGGMFDPTVGPLVNKWGFGPDTIDKLPNEREINQIMEYVGFDKISFENGYINKEFKESYIDFSSVAKGYAVDIIHSYIESKNILNSYVEIGGEVRVSGKNKNNDNWVLGIREPSFDGNINMVAMVSFPNMALATSGNYVNNYYVNDSLFFHTINPKSGYPSYTNMLSASVFSDDCLTSDAYATAFMTMDFNESKKILNSLSNVSGYFIYMEKGEIKSYTSDRLKPYITTNEE